MVAKPVCPDCQNTGCIRIETRVGEYTHQRDEFCPCPIGQRRQAESKPIPSTLEDTAVHVPLSPEAVAVELAACGPVKLGPKCEQCGRPDRKYCGCWSES